MESGMGTSTASAMPKKAKSRHTVQASTRKFSGYGYFWIFDRYVIPWLSQSPKRE